MNRYENKATLHCTIVNSIIFITLAVLSYLFKDIWIMLLFLLFNFKVEEIED